MSILLPFWCLRRLTDPAQPFLFSYYCPLLIADCAALRILVPPLIAVPASDCGFSRFRVLVPPLIAGSAAFSAAYAASDC